jgi:hypothetical protein
MSDPIHREQKGPEADGPGSGGDLGGGQTHGVPGSILSQWLQQPLSRLGPVRHDEQLNGDLTLREALVTDVGQLPVLRFIKEAAKTMASPDSASQRKAALALYLTTIAAAWVRHAKNISRQPPDRLAAWIGNLAGSEWVPPDLVPLLNHASDAQRGLAAASAPDKRAAWGGSETDKEPTPIRVQVRREEEVVALESFSAGCREVVIGSSPDCQVVLPGKGTAKRYLRVAWNPFFCQWLVHPLDEEVVSLGDQRLRQPTPAIGVKLDIGRHSIRILPGLGGDGPSACLAGEMSIIEDVPVASLDRYADEQAVGLARETVDRLNEISDRLAEAPTLAELYATACQEFVNRLGGQAAVIRVPLDGQIHQTRTLTQGESSSATDQRGLRLSATVLGELVRGRQTVLARAQPQDESDVQLTLVDQARRVVCVPIGSDHDGLISLYIDMPDLPQIDAMEGQIGFLNSVGRMLRLCRGSLAAAENRAHWANQQSQLQLAAEIQNRLLPRNVAELTGGAVRYRYVPAMWVGGDYCDVWWLPDGRVAFAVGDVTGKGVPGALVMSALHATLRAAGGICGSPAELMGLANDYVITYTPEGLFVSMVLGFFEPETGRISYVNAGHVLPFRFCPARKSEELRVEPGLVLGIQAFAYQDAEIQLADGEGLLIVTDGITEASTSEREMFGPEGVQSLLADSQCAWDGLLDRIHQAAIDFAAPAAQQDDVTLLILRKANA